MLQKKSAIRLPSDYLNNFSQKKQNLITSILAIFE